MDMNTYIIDTSRNIKWSLSLTFLLRSLFFLIEPSREVFLYFQKLFNLETRDTTSSQVSKICINSNLTGETRDIAYFAVCWPSLLISKQCGFFP